MENIINIINNSNILQNTPFFGCEVVVLFAFFVNMLLFLFCKRKSNTKKLSDFIVAIGFSINILMCAFMYFLNTNNCQFKTYLSDFLYLNSEEMLLKAVINAALLMFLFMNFKTIRQTFLKTPLINANLCMIGLFSCLMVQINNDILTFFFLDLVVFFIYKYASLIKPKKDKFFSSDFLLLNVISSVIFYLTIIILKFNDSDSQITILNTVLFLAYFLKLGIFPGVNYFSISNHKKNLPYLTLLSVYLPFLGVVGLVKIFNSTILASDIFIMISIVFLSLALFSVLILTLKTKNAPKFFAGVGVFFSIFVAINFLVSMNPYFSLKLASLYMSIMLSMFSLLMIFKINNKQEKLYFSAFRGVFLKNRMYAFFLSLNILFLFSVIPSALMTNSLFALKNIYSCDRFGYIVSFVFVFCYLLLLLKSFDLVLNCYNFDKNSKVKAFTKKTTSNYAVFFMVILFLVFVLIIDFLHYTGR